MAKGIGYLQWMEIGKTAYKTREDVKELLKNDKEFCGYRFASREETVFLLDCYFKGMKSLGGDFYEPGPAAKFIEDFSMGNSFVVDEDGQIEIAGKIHTYDKEINMLFWYGSDRELRDHPEEAFLGSIGLLTGNGKPVAANMRAYERKPGSESLIMPYSGVDYWCGFVLISKKASRNNLCAPSGFTVVD